MLLCQQCQKEAYLIRGLCHECGPKLHEEHNTWMEYVSEASQQFECKNGILPLSRWGEFETFFNQWLIERPDKYNRLMELSSWRLG